MAPDRASTLKFQGGAITISTAKVGRPPKVARDMGVFLAYSYHRSREQTAADSYEKLFTLFDGLCNDDAKVRQRIREAKKRLSSGGCVAVTNDMAFYFVPQSPEQLAIHGAAGKAFPVLHRGFPLPPDGASIWVWLADTHALANALGLAGMTMPCACPGKFRRT